MPAAWTKNAKCRYVDNDAKADFYSFDPKAIERAKSICSSCPVKVECLLSVGDDNAISAGMTKFDRLIMAWHIIEDESESNFS